MQPEPKIIKRYSNRKLYDTERSCYVTLDEISQMVKDGVEVKIIDNKTKDDLTSVTLTQIIFAEEKKQKSILPLSTLRNIIQSGGESLSEFFQKKIAEPVTHLREGAEKAMPTFFRRGEVAEGGQLGGFDDAGEEELEDGDVKEGSFREWFETQRSSLEEWQHRIDENLRDAVGNLTHLPRIRAELEKLHGRISEMEERLARLEGKPPSKGDT